jgi:alpha-glucosidase
MNKKLLFQVFLASFVVILFSCTKKSNMIAFVNSPDSLIKVQCMVSDSTGQVEYSISYKQKELILPSTVELQFKSMPPLGKGMQMLSVTNDSVNEKWDRLWGRNKHVTNNYNQVKIEFLETRRPKRKLNLYFRAYNDGVAIRYELPQQKGLDTIMLSDERITYNFTANHEAWPAFWNKFNLSQEVEFTKSKISDIKKQNIIGTPLLVNAGEAWVALLDANVTNWACSGITAGDYPNSLVTRTSWLPEDTTVAVKATTQRLSPWKVIMIADRPGRFIESDLVQNLNEPCAIDDVSWIKPGVSAWDWWWSGSYAPDVMFKVGPNTETMKYFVDFAAEMGWQYQIVDWQWYGPPFRPDGSYNMDADITKMIPDIDIPEIVKYAAGKNIGIFVWLLWPNADKQMEEAFALYEKWGVKGVKIDFMDRNDQEMVDFYHRVAKTAANHHLLVDFHGAYVPDGFSRTYPNLITREGVLGNEYNKWSNRITPLHCLTLPFTRMIPGEMDFTPGGFLNDMPENFKTVGGDSPAPHVMGTRSFQLAMFVVYESAFTVFCESPYNVRNQAGSDFLKGIPSSWDETRVLEGMPGEVIAVARRSGDKWYVGGMTLNDRTFVINTSFLEDKAYKAQIWNDAPDSDRNSRKLVKRSAVCGNDSELKLDAKANGGFVAIIEPAEAK